MNHDCRRSPERGQALIIYRWIYAISDGLLKDLDVAISSVAELMKIENG